AAGGRPRRGGNAAVMAARGRLWLVALAACYDPSFAHTQCGAGDACPAGQSCNRATGFCEVGDASIGVGSDGPTSDAQQCFGSGLVRVCLSSAPTQVLMFSGTTLDTSLATTCPRSEEHTSELQS